jgi:hypothetical protein
MRVRAACYTAGCICGISATRSVFRDLGRILLPAPIRACHRRGMTSTFFGRRILRYKHNLVPRRGVISTCRPPVGRQDESRKRRATHAELRAELWCSISDRMDDHMMFWKNCSVPTSRPLIIMTMQPSMLLLVSHLSLEATPHPK